MLAKKPDEGRGPPNDECCLIDRGPRIKKPKKMASVFFLRHIRDDDMKKSRIGALFVKAYEWIYYKFSPDVAGVMDRSHRFEKFIETIIVSPILNFLTGLFKPIYKMRSKFL